MRRKKKKIALALRSALAQWNKVLQKVWKGIQFDGNQLPSSIYTETPGKWKCFLRDLFVQRLDPEPPDPGYEPEDGLSQRTPPNLQGCGDKRQLMPPLALSQPPPGLSSSVHLNTTSWGTLSQITQPNRSQITDPRNSASSPKKLIWYIRRIFLLVIRQTEVKNPQVSGERWQHSAGATSG